MLGRRAEGHEFDAAYWGRNLRQTVRFTDAVSGLLERWCVDLRRVRSPSHSAALSRSRPRNPWVGRRSPSHAGCARRTIEQAALLAALGQLWAAGYPVEWERVMPERGRVVSLPLYPWQRERYWVEAAEIGSAAVADEKRASRPDDELLRLALSTTMGTVRYSCCTRCQQKVRWLVLSADQSVGAAMAALLARARRPPWRCRSRTWKPQSRSFCRSLASSQGLSS